METRRGKGIKREQMKIEKNYLLTLTYNKIPLFLLIDNCKLKGETLEYVTGQGRANIWRQALESKPLQNVAAEVKNKNFEDESGKSSKEMANIQSI